jgi:hypothetical protein
MRPLFIVVDLSVSGTASCGASGYQKDPVQQRRAVSIDRVRPLGGACGNAVLVGVWCRLRLDPFDDDVASAIVTGSDPKGDLVIMRPDFSSQVTASPPAEPQAEQRPLERTLHDLRLIDECAWLKAENWREVIRFSARSCNTRLSTGRKQLLRARSRAQHYEFWLATLLAEAPCRRA